MDRNAHFAPNGIPKKVRIYDNGGKTFDRYTVVFTGNYAGRDGICSYLGMSERPFHPQGFCQHGEHRQVIDRPRYGHLGKRIKFESLPEDCRKAVMQDYAAIWQLKGNGNG